MQGSAVLATTNWVQCERCQKWRRVTDEYARTVDDDVEWYCELNPDSQFADCSIPQEISDEQIDQEAAELAEMSARGALSAQLTPPPDSEQQQQNLPKLPAVIQLISENAFSHRKRKQQDEDDIMVCHCPPPWRGGDGCGPNCINRMLCIECTEDFCPCENQCTNQMFSRRQYAKVSVRRAGPKGFGLYTDEDLAAGQFVIQYVGEVLEEEEYLRRKHYYIQTGQRHYYFMNIGNGEVIDACRKGNVARFINHSCEPNCETQKWMVRGELAIGLFTLRKIKAGEELTFDYNFERYGDKPMRCFCGTKRCRKFIGGTQETTANIVELGDAEDVTNDPEPVLVQEEETDVLVQAMLDKEVGTTQRGWDAKLLARLQQLCRQKGIDWSYAADEAGLTASTQQAPAANSSFVPEDRSEESSHAAALHTVMAASPASSSAPATGAFNKLGVDGAESRPAGHKVAVKKQQKRKRSSKQVEDDPAAAAAALLRKQQQEERKRQRLLKQQERQQRQQQEFLRRQEEELLRLQRLREQQQAPEEQQVAEQDQEQTKQGKKRHWQQVADGDDITTPEEQQQPGPDGIAVLQEQQQEDAPSHDSELEDDMSSEDFQQGPASDVLDDEDSAEEPSEEEPEQQQQQQQPQKRPLSSRVKVVKAGRLKPPLAPKQQSKDQAAPPAKRSFLTLAVSAPTRPLKKRSEVDRRLEQLVQKQSWKLKEPSKQSVIKVLRMFNLCDITPRQPDNNALLQQQQQPAKQETSQGEPPEHKQAPRQQQEQQPPDTAGSGPQQAAVGGTAVVDEAGLPALPAHLQPLQALKGAELEARERESEARFKARQRARMADMGMLLDVVLASSSEKLKKEWVTCGILTQLHQALGRLPFTQEYSVVLVKVVAALEHLPVTSDDLYTMRSAHGTFADLIRRMASSAVDWEVRRRSHQLLKRYSAASCSDATLLQLYNLPGPNGKPYLLSLHLPPPQLSRLTAMLPKSEQQPRKRISRRRTPPIRGPGPGPWPPPMLHGPPGSFGPPHFGAPAAGAPGEPHSSPSTSHGGPGGPPPAAGVGQEGGSSMAADSSGGWPPQQQQWEGSGLPPPPWATGGAPPPHLPPPGSRPGRHPRHMGWPAVPGGPPFGGPMPRPGSSGLAGPAYGPGPSPGDMPDRPEGAGPGSEGGAGAGQHGGAGVSSRGFGGPAGDRSPGPEGAYGRGPGHGDGPGARGPDWHVRGPRGDWEAGGGPGRGGRGLGQHFGPGPMGPFDGRPMPHGFREREWQRGWGWRESDWEGGRGREREREWGPQQSDGPYGSRHDAEAAAAKRQRREPFDDPDSCWAYGSPHDQPHHRMPPPSGGWHGDGPYGSDPHRSSSRPWMTDLADEPMQGEQGWQRGAAAAASRGSRPSRWDDAHLKAPAARAPNVPPGTAGVEELFVLGLYDSLVTEADWQAWCDAVGPGGANGGLSPIVSGRFSPVLPGEAAGRLEGRPHSPGLPPGEPCLAMEEVFSVLQDPVLATRTPGVAISACVTAQQQPRRQELAPAGGWDQQGPGSAPTSGQQQQHPGQHHRQQLHGTPSEQQPNQLQPQQQYPDSWEQPGPDFELFVGESVKHRLGKYVQPDHPNRITKEEAQQLYKKLRRQIVDKESAACAERHAAGTFKPIERSKLEANIKEFVRLSIRRLHASRPGAVAAGGHHASAGHHSGQHGGINGWPQRVQT